MSRPLDRPAETPAGKDGVGDRRLPVTGLRDSLVGGVAAALLMVLIWAGSLALTTFDSALIGYAVAVVALTFAIVARYSRWLRMPSTRRYWRRGWQLFASWGNFRKLPGLFPRAVFSQLLGQGFIRRRGVVRWIGHQCLFWGVIGATLITFPLAFGWLVFHLQPGTAATYRMFVFGVPTIAFDTTSFLGWSIFRGLAYMERSIFVDPSRCIACGACVAACRECDTHRGKSMMNLDFIDRGTTVEALPTVCMHCSDPFAPCAQVCPVDAILSTDDGVVHSPDVSRCIGCTNCVHACPRGVPKFDPVEQLACNCNLCYDRTSVGLGPMCATVCPSDALYYGTAAEVEAARPNRRVIDVFGFGEQELQTGNWMVVPDDFHLTTLPLAP